MAPRALLALCLLQAGCSLLVPEEPERLRCSEEGAIGPPACGAAEVCAGGECVECRAEDACGDGVDDDCDGEIDEGC